jgi:uncharacterized Zn finger protein
MFCPSCGCSVIFHREVERIGDETIARCENCGPCWRTANTPFLEAVERRIASERSQGRAAGRGRYYPAFGNLDP